MPTSETTRFWRCLAIGSSLLVILMGLLLLESCPTKPKPSPAVSTVIYGDTTRIKLVHRADSSASALTIIHQRANSTVTSYGKSVQQFDSIQVSLP